MADLVPPAPTTPAPPSNRRRGLIILALVLSVALGGGLTFWVHGRIHVSTDNAFVEAPVHLVAPQVGGQVLRVLVQDNQAVAAGDVLVELDDAEYRAALRKAEALLVQAQDLSAGDEVQVREAEAVRNQAEVALAQARLDLKRGEALLAGEVMPRETVERLRTAVALAEGRLRQSEEGVARAQAQLGRARSAAASARIAQRQAEVDEARLHLEHTRIVAPVAGLVTRKNVELGNTVRPGQTLLTVVETAAPWVIANLKETQLTHVRSGQPVRLTLDALPGAVYHGTVDSLMAGTGSAFALLPPENATGNYVKVVQRVPVKIRFAPGSDLAPLRVGMSVVPEIDTGRTPAAVLGELVPGR